MLDEPSRLRAGSPITTSPLTTAVATAASCVGAERVRVIGNLPTHRNRGDRRRYRLYGPGDTRGPDRGWRIVGNDVSGVDPLNIFGGPAAQIWLGDRSSNCLVVGGCARPRSSTMSPTTPPPRHRARPGGAARALGARAPVTGKALMFRRSSEPAGLAPAGRGAATTAAPRPARHACSRRTRAVSTPTECPSTQQRFTVLTPRGRNTGTEANE